MGRVLTVTYVFLLLGIQPFVDIPAEREVQSVSAGCGADRRNQTKDRTDF